MIACIVQTRAAICSGVRLIASEWIWSTVLEVIVMRWWRAKAVREASEAMRPWKDCGEHAYEQLWTIHQQIRPDITWDLTTTIIMLFYRSNLLGTMCPKFCWCKKTIPTALQTFSVLCHRADLWVHTWHPLLNDWNIGLHVSQSRKVQNTDPCIRGWDIGLHSQNQGR